MAQGKQWTDKQREIIMQSLQSYLELGFSRQKACDSIGLPATTLSYWLKNDEALRMKINGWENAGNMLALANIRDAMMRESEMTEDTKKETSKWWAERKMKKDFSTRTEQTGADGKDLYIINDELREKINKALDQLDD